MDLKRKHETDPLILCLSGHPSTSKLIAALVLCFLRGGTYSKGISLTAPMVKGQRVNACIILTGNLSPVTLLTIQLIVPHPEL